MSRTSFIIIIYYYVPAQTYSSIGTQCPNNLFIYLIPNGYLYLSRCIHRSRQVGSSRHYQPASPYHLLRSIDKHLKTNCVLIYSTTDTPKTVFLARNTSSLKTFEKLFQSKLADISNNFSFMFSTFKKLFQP